MMAVGMKQQICIRGVLTAVTLRVQEILHYAKLCMGAYSLTPEDAVKDSEFVVKVESVHKLVTHNTDGKCPAHVSLRCDF
jgi:hypothetical protein